MKPDTVGLPDSLGGEVIRVTDTDGDRATWTFPADLNAVRAARRAVREQLRRWELDGVTDLAELLVSELVTNALRHGRTDAEPQLSVVFTSEQIVIAVDDHSAVRPSIRCANSDAESGRGLFLVDALADAWGVSPDGTTTWAVLNVTGQRS
jgi:anti-sigma regulatory factor (Ser/Thr protein kinase)